MPVFQHGEQDLASFKMIVSQFYVMGVAKQSDLVRAFGVNGLLVKRAVKQYREEGPQGFFAPRKYRGAAVLTTEVCTQAQYLLDQGETPSAVAHRLGLKVDTLSKAVRTGRLRRPSASGSGAGSIGAVREASCKSERSAAESEAEMGVAATNVIGRVAASLGLNAAIEVVPQFTPALDVAGGGVLLALPALLAVGLLRHTERHFTLPQGYYTLYNIFLLLAFLALGRVKSLEQLRREPPGEWGKLLGLDRIPEVKTLREKVKYLTEKGEPFPWSAALCRDWMNDTPEQAHLYYVDGHVRVYHGSQTALPKHYVSRQRLCLRATVDYWVNAMDGQPFFDTVKMVAYRSETAMAHTLGEHMARGDDVRALLCAIYTTAVDLFPDPAVGTLTVRLHRMASRAHDKAVAALCEELTATETVYPGTNLRLVYELVSSQSP